MNYFIASKADIYFENAGGWWSQLLNEPKATPASVATVDVLVVLRFRRNFKAPLAVGRVGKCPNLLVILRKMRFHQYPLAEASPEQHWCADFRRMLSIRATSRRLFSF